MKLSRVGRRDAQSAREAKFLVNGSTSAFIDG